MDENKQYVSLTCKREGCGRSFRVLLPKKMGAYQVKCPEGHVNQIKFVPKEIQLDEGDNASGKDILENTVSCPWDCGVKFKFETKDDGVKTCNCPHCNGTVKITVKEGKIVAVERKQTAAILHREMTGKGKLTLVRFKGILGKMAHKSYLLHLGRNTIGRYDENLRCDIEIYNDTYASRRSVLIEVMDKNPGYLYRMSVLKAANPVMHNNRPLTAGEVVYLNYGDSIRLGNTIFNFEKA